MNPPLRRPGIRPPQPVDIDNPLWLAMFYQWLIDTLTHLDECMDKTQTAHEETRTEMSVWMTAAKETDEGFSERLREHVAEHAAIDRTAKAKRSVWAWQWDSAKEAFKFATSGAVTAGVVILLKALGLL